MRDPIYFKGNSLPIIPINQKPDQMKANVDLLEEGSVAIKFDENSNITFLDARRKEQKVTVGHNFVLVVVNKKQKLCSFLYSLEKIIPERRVLRNKEDMKKAYLQILITEGLIHEQL